MSNKEQICGSCTHYQKRWDNYHYHSPDGKRTPYGEAGVCKMLDEVDPSVINKQNGINIPGRDEIVLPKNPCSVQIVSGLLFWAHLTPGFTPQETSGRID